MLLMIASGSFKWILKTLSINLVDRSKMMGEVRKHLPDISYLPESIYGVEAVLNLGDTTILSTAGAGVHQGDPLASLLFSLPFCQWWSAWPGRFPTWWPMHGSWMTEHWVGGSRTYSKPWTS